MQLKLPFLHESPAGKQLFVDGEAFIVRGAELQNSSMTSADFMKGVWQKLAAAHVNTVLGCVPWDMIEPEEGEFNFSELDSVIEGAREYGLRLILLWFGSFKNGLSTYAPEWVKKDTKRFPRAKLRKSGGVVEVADVLSIFHTEAQIADARAFNKLMQHLKDVDENHFTVIMVQVENEVGLLGDSRDGSATANDRFNSPVPQKLIDVLSDNWNSLHSSLRANLTAFRQLSHENINNSWEAVFGHNKRTEEIFMAYHYALYLEYIASAGKAVYPLPIYTNVWQDYTGDDSENDLPVVAGGGGNPGDYPSGGAVVNVLDIWQYFAPALDFIAPDIYLNNYSSVCAKYRHRNQPLFIPEQRRDEYGARRIWIAYGNYQAIGTAPFGMDTLELEENPFKKHYGLLAKVSSYVLAAQRTPGSIIGFYFDELTPTGKDLSPAVSVTFGTWHLNIERSFVFGKPSPGFGLVIQTGDAKFLLVGEGFQVTFTSTDSRVAFTGILRFVEKEVVNEKTGEMRTWRTFGGDETRSGQSAVMPAEDPDYGSFPISITIPARTRIAECEVYALNYD
ncbi:putative glycosyl hydrolases family 35 [Bisporella sp. PMI_857]|nr:putative glycosyl hydrolases family 35 [Bisporella sp. PMI_857]